ncbi:MAG: hypothetical protein ABIR68_06680 [Ilumatobacteraceae bacterium]
MTSTMRGEPVPGSPAEADGHSIDESPQPADGVHLSRRSMIHRLGAGIATVVVAGIGVGSYRVFDNGVLDAGSGDPYDAWSHWRDDPSPLGAVGAAILAANPHNSQPWIFHVTPTGIDLFADRTRLTGTLDSLGREHHIGLGCALENLVLAVAARGYRPTVTLLPAPGDPTHVAAVELSPGPVAQSSIHAAIGDRHSNRGPYTTATIAAGVLEGVAADALDLPGVSVRWFSEPAERTALGALIIEATDAIIHDEQQSIDSFTWFRNDRDDIDTHMDGLTLDAQGLSPLLLAAAKLLPATKRSAGDSFWLDQTRTVHTATAAAYGVVVVADPTDTATQLVGGRLLQRIHLSVSNLGIALQPMNQITERIDREAVLGHAATFAGRMDELLARPGEHALTTFRVGHPVRPGRRSPRRPATDVVR